MLMGGPKSNVPFGVGKRTFIKLFASFRNWKSVSSFVGSQIKAKEDHLMRLYIFM